MNRSPRSDAPTLRRRSPALWVIVGLAACGGDRDEQTGTLAAPISYGTTDVGNLWPEVGQLQLAGGGGFCTATLVTPRYALAASHCFTQSPRWNANINVVFDVAPSTATAPITGVHTNAASGNVFTRFPQVQTVPQLTATQASQDVALLRLDRAVGLVSAQIAGFNSATDTFCYSGSYGRALGYGPLSNGGTDPQIRRYSIVDTWNDREPNPPTDAFMRSTTRISNPGDSGVRLPRFVDS